MNRTRRKRYKPSTAKRLVQSSFVLSLTRVLSVRILRFFESGFASPLVKSVKTVDNFARDKITGPIFKKIGLRDKFSKPIRNGFASLFTDVPILNRLNSMLDGFLSCTLRVPGVFLLTFGIYAAASFLLKRYITSSLGAASPNDLVVSAIAAAVGLILIVLGDKDIRQSLGSGRITGSLLVNILGVNPSSFATRLKSNSKPFGVGLAFALGTLIGVLSLFFTPLRIFAVIAAFLFVVAVLSVPEFGMLLTVFGFSFLPLSFSVSVASLTFVSFLLKCARLKRNFRFGSADALALLMLLAVWIYSSVTGGVSDGESSLLWLITLYFTAKNLLTSERIIYQSFNALTYGLSVGMALYILGGYSSYISHEELRSAVAWLSSNVLSTELLFMAIASILPFALISYSVDVSIKPNNLFVILALGCAVVTDSLLGYALLFIAFFVFIATVAKAPVGSALGVLIVGPPAFALIYDFAFSNELTLGLSVKLDSVFASENCFSNFWSSFVSVGGGLASVFFVGALLLVLQRIFSSLILSRSKEVVQMCGTLASALLITIFSLFSFNSFADIRTVGMIFFITGSCGGAYKYCSKLKNSDWEV